MKTTASTSRFLGFSLASAALGCVTAFSTPSFAQPPPLPKVVEPAPNQAAAAAPAPVEESVQITATCSLGEHAGIDAGEARMAADIVCHELAKRGATNTHHEVRMGKLGGRTMVTLASRNGNAYDERRTFVTGLDEINLAGPRLADALTSGKELEETRTVDNVLGSEAVRAKQQQGTTAFDMSLFGAAGVGASTGASAGFELGFGYRAGSFGVGAHGRAGGIGSSDAKLSLASFDFGGKIYLSSGDFAPFVGAGLGVAHFAVGRKVGADISGSGIGAYGEVGAEVLRTHHVAFTISLRVDTPFFDLEGQDYNYSAGNYSSSSSYNSRTSGSSQVSEYVVPTSLNMGLLFH